MFFALTSFPQSIALKIDSVEKYYTIDPKASIEFLNHLIPEAKSANNNKALHQIHLIKSLAYSNLGEFDSCLNNINKAENLCKINQWQKELINTQIEKANLYIDFNAYSSAFLAIDSAKTMALAIGDTNLYLRVLSSTVKIDYYQEKYNHCRKTLNQAQHLLSEIENPSYSNIYYQTFYLGNVQADLQVYDSALVSYKTALSLAKRNNDLNKELKMLDLVGNLYREMHQLDSAEKYLDMAFALIPNASGFAYEDLLQTSAFLDQYKGDERSYEKKFDTLFLLAKNWPIRPKVNLYHNGFEHYLIKAWTQEQMGDKTEAYQNYYYSVAFANEYIKFLKEYNELENKIAIEDLKARYENDALLVKNEVLAKENQKVKARNRLYIVLSVAFGLGVIVTIIIMVLVRKNLENQKKLANAHLLLKEKEIEELKGKQKIERLAALLEGQEKERARIAAELHDGIGGLLASAKHYFQAVESTFEKEIPEYKKAYEILDDTAIEVRRISHNMASKVLQKFGLKAAIEDIAKAYTSKALLVKTTFNDLPENLPKDVELNVFRIVQELMSNVLKHANASLAQIQITNLDDELSVIIDDNGKGFIPTENNNSLGIGFSNLNLRLDQLSGTIEIDSTPNHGTTILISIPLENKPKESND